MKLKSLKYLFIPKRIRWFLISLMKKYLEKQGELNKPLTKVEQFEIARRVANAQDCFYNDNCSKCGCNMVDAINTKDYYCKEGCFPPAMETNEELEEYLMNYNYKFGKSIITRNERDNI